MVSRANRFTYCLALPPIHGLTCSQIIHCPRICIIPATRPRVSYEIKRRVLHTECRPTIFYYFNILFLKSDFQPICLIAVLYAFFHFPIIRLNNR